MNMKKHIIFVIILILLFLLFLYVYLKPNNYTIEYQINGLKINESYNLEDKVYYFILNYQGEDYKVISTHKYIHKRKLIKNIDLKEQNQLICLNIKSEYIDFYPICINENNNEYYSAFYNDEINFEKKEIYENIEINNLDEKTYLLWNYRDFIILDNNNKNKITLFNKDIYNIKMFYQYENYLLIPNYDQEFTFDKMYLLNIKNSKIKTINLRFELYFDSYFLGNEKDKIYLYDTKEKQEYYIDISKEEIYKTKNQILNEGKWETVSSQELINDKLKFNEIKIYEYILKDNNLYFKIYNDDKLLQIINKKVDTLVSQDEFDVYYISNDILYKFNIYEGETALLKYTEWNFNNKNMVFIFE